MRRLLTCFIIIAALSASPLPAKKQPELWFFCGAAVTVPMNEIIAAYQKQTGVKVNVTYAGSGTLLSQMQLSRKGDVYLSGSPDYIAIGEQKGLLLKHTSRRIAYLIPAIIVPKSNPNNITTLADLARPGIRVGIGNPETVCLGLYSIELLTYNNLLETVMPNVVVFAKSCEETAMFAALGKVDAIIGWNVFASWNPNQVAMIKLKPGQIPRLSYIPIAVPVFVKNRERADNFIDYVLSDTAQSIFTRWGYLYNEAEAGVHAPQARIGGEYLLPDKYFRIIKHEK